MIKKPDCWSVKYHYLFTAGGFIFSAIAVYIYNYHYILSEDDLLGLIAACALFAGALLLGQGIRGWNEMNEYNDQFIHVSGRGGFDASVRKRMK